MNFFDRRNQYKGRGGGRGGFRGGRQGKIFNFSSSWHAVIIFFVISTIDEFQISNKFAIFTNCFSGIHVI